MDEELKDVAKKLSTQELMEALKTTYGEIEIARNILIASLKRSDFLVKRLSILNEELYIRADMAELAISDPSQQPPT